MVPTNIFWNSNAPWSVSGYGQQTTMFVPRFKELGHNMAIGCFYGLEGALLPGWPDKTRGEFVEIPCYPTDWTRFNSLLLGDYAAHHFGGDRGNGLVFTLQDLWPLLGGVQTMEGLRFVCWTPVDHDPCPPRVAEFIQRVNAQAVAMTQHGRKMLQERDIDPVGVVPHGIDTKLFRPLRENRVEIRRGLGVPQDAFVVGMVACNQGLPSRKSFPQVFEAFAEFHKRHTDAILYVHGDVYGRNSGIHLPELATACGIPGDALRGTNPLHLHLGMPPEAIAHAYNGFDVLCVPAMGEGFGIPLIESQACGTPVITSDFTAMSEHCGAGWLVEGDRFWDQPQGSFQYMPRVGSILDALEEAYEHAEGMADKAIEFAQRYDVDTVMEQDWLPILERVTAPREIPALQLAA